MNGTKLLLVGTLGIGILILCLGIYLAFIKPSGEQSSPSNTEVGNSSNPVSKSQLLKEVKVFAASPFTDTGIQLAKGQTIYLSATGQVNGANKQTDGAFRWVSPDGWNTEPEFNIGREGLLQSGQPFMSLVARISQNKPTLDDGNWTFIGSNGQITATENGILYLSVNDKVRDSSGAYHPEWFADNQGQITVTISGK